jgi:putative oxidoreductase
MVLNILVTAISRVLLVMLFLPFSALDKILNFRGAVKQASQAAPGRVLPVLLILTGLAVEIVMPLGILTGVSDRLAAFILAGYCGVTALLWKQFWRPGDFWSGGKGRDLFWDFLKNFAVAGGFLMICFAPHQTVQSFIDHPFSSTHPYAGAAP